MIATGSALRSTPGSDIEIAKMLSHRARGTTPGNPKWYKQVLPPKQFEFKRGAKPVYPKGLLTVIAKPKPVLVWCADGPFNGEQLDLSICDAGAKTGPTSTLPFRLNGESGRYVDGMWEVA